MLEKLDQHTPVSPAAKERLDIFIEECAEAIKVAAKIQRFGWNPTHDGITYDNRKDLETEMGDIRAAMIRMCEASDVLKAFIHQRAEYKLRPGSTILHHQE